MRPVRKNPKMPALPIKRSCPDDFPQDSWLTSPRLYVKNLDEKTNKTELKRALYMLFTQFGPVLDIVTTRVGSKGQKMRGQAHVVFKDIQTATQAMRALKGFDFLGKELVCSAENVMV